MVRYVEHKKVVTDMTDSEKLDMLLLEMQGMKSEM